MFYSEIFFRFSFFFPKKKKHKNDLNRLRIVFVYIELYILIYSYACMFFVHFQFPVLLKTHIVNCRNILLPFFSKAFAFDVLSMFISWFICYHFDLVGTVFIYAPHFSDFPMVGPTKRTKEWTMKKTKNCMCLTIQGTYLNYDCKYHSIRSNEWESMNWFKQTQVRIILHIFDILVHVCVKASTIFTITEFNRVATRRGCVKENCNKIQMLPLI